MAWEFVSDGSLGSCLGHGPPRGGPVARRRDLVDLGIHASENTSDCCHRGMKMKDDRYTLVNIQSNKSFFRFG